MKPGPFDRTHLAAFRFCSDNEAQLEAQKTRRFRLVEVKGKKGLLASRISPIELPPSFPLRRTSPKKAIA